MTSIFPETVELPPARNRQSRRHRTALRRWWSLVHPAGGNGWEGSEAIVEAEASLLRRVALRAFGLGFGF